MMTLQDVIDAAVTCPERYGREKWFQLEGGRLGKPVCPMAVEVLADFVGREVVTPPGGSSKRYSQAAAERLGCHAEHVGDFICWWDGNQSPVWAGILRQRGYRVP